MELRHLRYVVAVAETLHFSEAARRLNISQPPLSQQIRLLEDELGVRLFERTKRHVQLTAAGEMFVEEARLVLAQADHAGKVGERMLQGEVGQLIIGVAGPADADYFVEILRTFARHATSGHSRYVKRLRRHAGRYRVVASVEGAYVGDTGRVIRIHRR